ncbi:hypothetical protein, partial [Pectobacterium parmentieri]|uniref:hypothetical protein n=1 Tax=Pectobacterium parmentieri TaxID=1905730 RepID=UPI001E484578
FDADIAWSWHSLAPFLVVDIGNASSLLISITMPIFILLFLLFIFLNQISPKPNLSKKLLRPSRNNDDSL